MTIEEVNALSRDDFIARFGPVVEHSSWVAERAESRRPFISLSAMESAMRAVVDLAGEAARIALLRAHPELAGKAAIDHELTDASAAEQASAGLDRLTPDEFAAFHDLNRRYGERFGFPFIICVRLTDKAGILAAMRERLDNDRAVEIATALGEVGRIVNFRLAELLR